MTAMQHEKPVESDLGADRRRFRRVSMPLSVRYRLPNGSEAEGKIINISPAGALISAPDGAAYGDTILLYIAKLGRFTGTVKRIERDGFAIHLNERAARIKRVADTLIWLLNGGEENMNRRKAKRIRQDRPAKIMVDGKEQKATILDISTTGASIAFETKPDIGTVLTVGRTKATVVRHHEEGVGVSFADNLPAKK